MCLRTKNTWFYHLLDDYDTDRQPGQTSGSRRGQGIRGAARGDGARPWEWNLGEAGAPSCNPWGWAEVRGQYLHKLPGAMTRTLGFVVLPWDSEAAFSEVHPTLKLI